MQKCKHVLLSPCVGICFLFVVLKTSLALARQESNYTILMYTILMYEMGEVMIAMKERTYDQPSMSQIVIRTALLNPMSQVSNLQSLGSQRVP